MKLKTVLPALGLVLLFSAAWPVTAAEGADDRQVLRILHMLDYIAVDYPEFVQNGRVLNQAEYQEQIDFAGEVANRLAELPAPHKGSKAELQTRADALRQAIGAKAGGSEIARRSNELAVTLRTAYPVTEAPRNAPDVARAEQLFMDNCSACHGETGAGDGVAGAGMEPPPTNFLDYTRQHLRSPFGLYNVISLGVEGTGMPSFAALPEEQRWALAYYVGQMIYTDAQREQGRTMWSELPPEARITDLKTLSTLMPADLEARFGKADGQALTAYLRANPQAVTADKPSPLQHAMNQLAASAQKYAEGDAGTAGRLALDAYLEGYELAEAAVTAADADLNQKIEASMLAYRQLIKKSADNSEVQQQADLIQLLLKTAADHIDGGNLSAASSFVGSFIILTREGLEAILVLAAMFAFLRKTERRDASKFVHAGWILALVAGLVTWFAATYLVAISGAGRELTEGISALLAAAVLLSVGLWLHSKSYASAWQQYVAERMGHALSSASLWGLTGLAFIATFREVFETILFYQALWQQGDQQAILIGMLVAAVVLVGVSVAVFMLSMRLPIAQFFAASATLIILLAIIFAGKGVAALQEAGYLPVDSIDFVSLPMLGIYPNLQSLGIQAAVVVTILVGAVWNHMRQRRVVVTEGGRA